MNWSLEYSEKAKKQISKLDPTKRTIILSWMDKNINNCENPRLHGKGLVGDHSGEWRYRIGHYRILCEIQDSKLVVLTLSVGHRSSVY